MSASAPTGPRGGGEGRALAEALFTSIGDGAIATDEYGKITRINPPALQMLGYKESELIGKWFPRVIEALNADGQNLTLIERPITKAFLAGQTISEKMHYKRKNGALLPVAVTVSPIMIGRRPVGAIEVFRDITLEVEIDRMKSDFISLASHQLRTPLSAVKTYAHMLVDGYMGDINQPQKRSLRTIIAAANRMNELISTLLNVTRIESGNIVVSMKQVNLNKLIEDVTKELAVPAVEKNIQIQIDSAAAQPLNIRTDQLILKEILANLLSNAIKYSPNESPVRMTARSKGRDAEICVEDSGWGIPKEAQEQIFTKFFRAQNVSRRETSGTGLGLYLVKGLVERLGGRIWFESTEDKGTRFYVSVPKQPPDMRGKRAQIFAAGDAQEDEL